MDDSLVCTYTDMPKSKQVKFSVHLYWSVELCFHLRQQVRPLWCIFSRGQFSYGDHIMVLMATQHLQPRIFYFLGSFFCSDQIKCWVQLVRLLISVSLSIFVAIRRFYSTETNWVWIHVSWLQHLATHYYKNQSIQETITYGLLVNIDSKNCKDIQL